MKKLLIIDTFNFLHRAYHALPKTFTDNEGNPTNAIYGVASMLINIFETIKPDYVVAALDGEKPTFRVEDFTGYKAHRRPMENDLASQIPGVLEIIDSFRVKKLVVEGYEADDLIGTIAEKLANEDIELIIASNDRDLWQLSRENVLFMLPSTKDRPEWLGEREVNARLGFEPNLLVDYKGLRGDPSDNIPGVYGVGDKTARDLITKYGSVEGIYKHIDDVTPETLRQKLLNNYEEALMSKKLAKIITDAPVEFDLESCRYSEFNKADVKRMLEKYNFKSLVRRLGFEVSSGGVKKQGEPAPGQVGLF